MGHRGSLAIELDRVRPRADEVLVVLRLEFVRLAMERDEVGDAEVRDARAEFVSKRKGEQRRVPTGTSPGDLDAQRIDVAALGEVTRSRGAVLYVDLSPTAAEPVTVVTSVACAAPVVQIDDRDAATREELNSEVERCRDVRRRSAVDGDDEGRQLAGRADELGILRRVVEAVRRQTVCAGEIDCLRNGEVTLVELELCRPSRDALLSRLEVERHHGR